MSKTEKGIKRREQRVIVYDAKPPQVYGNFKLFCQEKGLSYNSIMMRTNFSFPFEFDGVKVYREKIIKGNTVKKNE